MEEIIRSGLAEAGIPAPEGAVELLCRYGDLLLEANRTTNLTAIRDPASAARLHFLDCAELLPLAELGGKSVIDVGTGAGFPGIVLRILQPDIRLTTLDSVRRKTDFVRRACTELGLADVTCLWGRAEELPALRESFDAAVSRAVAALDILAELCLPLVKPGGLFLAMKGPACDEEVQTALPAIGKLGGRLRTVARYTIPGTDVTHAAVIVEKEKNTPPQFPRRYALITKKPIRG